MTNLVKVAYVAGHEFTHGMKVELRHQRPISLNMGQYAIDLKWCYLRNSNNNYTCVSCGAKIYRGWLYAPFGSFRTCLTCVRPREDVQEIPEGDSRVDTSNASESPIPIDPPSPSSDLNDARTIARGVMNAIGDCIIQLVQPPPDSPSVTYQRNRLQLTARDVVEALREISDDMENQLDALGQMEHRWFQFLPPEYLVPIADVVGENVDMWYDEKPIRRDPEMAQEITLLEVVRAAVDDEIRRR